VRGARRATIRQLSRSARGTRRATIRRTGAGHCARRAARHHLPARHRPPAVALGARRNTIRRLLALSGVESAGGLLLSQICCPKVGGIASNAWNQLSIRVSNGRTLNKNIHTNCERISEFIEDFH
jgi:hypothetical protein